MKKLYSIDSADSPSVYTLSVASELSGATIYSIRQYIDRGLLIPYLTHSHRLRFSDVDIVRLRCIRKYLSMGLNVAGVMALLALIPCWKLKPCLPEDQELCDAFTCSSSPCWEAANKGLACRSENCRVCQVYKLPEECSDLKSFLKLIDN